MRILKKIRPNIEIILVRSGKGAPCLEELKTNISVNSIDDALKLNLDGAIICSPASYHVSQLLQFCKKKVPILVEKPVAHQKKHISILQTIDKKKKVPILVGYQLRYSKGSRFFYKKVISGLVGVPIRANIKCLSYLPNWRPDQDYRIGPSAKKNLGGGVLLELSHELDYANWFFGKFLNIKAYIKNTGILDIEVEDIAELKLTSYLNFPVFIKLSFSSKKEIRDCILKGSKGILSWNVIKNIVTWKPNNGKKKKWYFDKNKDSFYKSQLIHFLSCIEHNKKPLVPLNHGIYALKLALSAKLSNNKKKVIILK